MSEWAQFVTAAATLLATLSGSYAVILRRREQRAKAAAGDDEQTVEFARLLSEERTQVTSEYAALYSSVLARLSHVEVALDEAERSHRECQSSLSIERSERERLARELEVVKRRLADLGA